jgi:hypothetical protein
MISTFEQAYIKCFVAFHLDVLKHQFESRELDKNLIKNSVDIQFIINCDNGKILGFKFDNLLNMLMRF